MSPCRRLLALLPAGLVAGLSGGSEVAYVGSTACDGADPTCRDQPRQQQFMRALEVQENGSLVPLPQYSVDVGGLPLWFAQAPQPGGGAACVLLTRVDTNELLAYTVDPFGKLVSTGVAGPSGGQTPVHASAMQLDGGSFVLVANYNWPDLQSASVAVLRLEEGCRLSLTDRVVHRGVAHIHSVVPGRNGLLYACDLGTDAVFAYRLSAQDGRLLETARFQAPAGFGPRHLALHPSRPLAYLVCEMAQVVLVLDMEERTGALRQLQEVSLLADGETREGSKAAEILISPDGAVVYASNRGVLNTVTSFLVGDDGLLTRAAQVDVPAYPRGVALARGGAVLLVAGQSSSEVASFRVEAGGQLVHVQTVSQGDGVPPNPGAFAVLAAAGV